MNALPHLRRLCNTFALPRAVKFPELSARLHTAAGLDDQAEPKDDFRGRSANAQNAYHKKSCMFYVRNVFTCSFIHTHIPF